MCVKDNLKFTKLEGKAVTLTTDVMNALYKLEGEKVFDYIFWILRMTEDSKRGY